MGLPRLHLKLAIVDFVVAFGEDGIVTLLQHGGRERPCIGENGRPVAALDGPVDIGNCLAAGLGDQLERDLRRLVVERFRAPPSPAQLRSNAGR